jgi:hypothetical protein
MCTATRIKEQEEQERDAEERMVAAVRDMRSGEEGERLLELAKGEGENQYEQRFGEKLDLPDEGEQSSRREGIDIDWDTGS